MNDMTEKPPLRPQIAVSRPVRLNGGWLPLIERYSLIWLSLLLLVVLPLALGDFRLGLAGKYLSLAFCAVGMVMIWGYGGILSLGQGIFFGLGSYMMAMYLKLEATATDEAASALAAFYGSALPDFMIWNSVEALPWWWKPFESATFTLAAILILPALLAFLFSYAYFKKRVGGVYFSIITLSLASIMSIMIIGQQGYTGGVNGLTDFKTAFGMSLQTPQTPWILYLITTLLLLACVAMCGFILRSRLGKVVVAIRDREDRVRFSGYNTALFKAFIFAVAALISALGGVMFTLQVGLASPSLVGIIPSTEIVIYAALGGRLSLVGAVYGTLLIGAAKTWLSENFVSFWQYFIGFLFMAVVLFLPTGLAGLLQRLSNKEVQS
ncbi:urea ABC transporter permease subunit UrtC [Pseudomonas syringae pv. tagetis]|uniref:Branched-chain amino acid ABC transporter, permease protein n=2 Tax=Pseudomonas syringae group genomosp. 7 TaxID=251699 RepID=A0A0Q0CGH0_9PSED|nr:urea ABC transporter permease subunit UrtC [Pseudomonas syringae group genomosp. 7]KPX49095.1 Branched-chain amino acid ABC transporter, permease protein [Pseudomonas syringae pv. helianthi]KPY86924.1 Branched-chain amino acid ABC transporter, permease protein [Pseudomonas syringae pv. tagetis]RMW13765.1 Branched-chain amino acid ABC transporter, permease protein [Pseudomonas syringae pv. tagetis]RMW23642.1 Branched-chain amino acid ABC transporter, permease protein [Pseudomonas syringae pv.